MIYYLDMAKLKELREKQFLSQEELSRKAETTTGTINRLENGKQKPRFATRRKIARALNVKPAEIDF